MTFTIITLTGVSEMIGYGASDEMMKQKVLLRVLISLMLLLLLQVYLWCQGFIFFLFLFIFYLFILMHLNILLNDFVFVRSFT
jgi:hypothetical protein